MFKHNNMSCSPRSSTQINLMEDFDFTTLTRHELEILDDFTAGESDINLRPTELLNSIMKVFQKIWRERDMNAKAAQAIEFVDFSEYQGSKANNPMYSLLVLRMVLKFAKDKGDEALIPDIYEKMKVEWGKLLDWFNWRNDEEEEGEEKEEEPVEFAVSHLEFAQYRAFQEGRRLGLPSWFMNNNTKAHEIMNKYDELVAHYGY
jgi:hypothetical protein